MPVSVKRAIPQRLWLNPPRPMPMSLQPLADIGSESDAIGCARRDAIWRSMKQFYRAGMNPGMSLAIRHRGELVFNRALGYADMDTGRLLKVDDPVCLFSASKAVTATLVHLLVDDGSLKLSDKVADYVPEFAVNGKQDISILDLLAHRAGIPRIKDASAELLFDTDEAIRRLLAATPESSAGKRQAYHAVTGGFVLGELIERVTGKPLNQVLDERLRQPLGMRYFHYGIHGAEQHKVPRHYLTGYNPAPIDAFIKHAVGAKLGEAVDVSNDARFMDAVVPAGNLYATAEETTRFYQLLLDGGNWQGQQLLGRDTIHQATRPVSRFMELDASLLLPVRFSAGFMLGARVLSLFGTNTQRAFGHLGFVSITTWADPARQLSVALMTTGKGIIGPSLPLMFKLFNDINKLG